VRLRSITAGAPKTMAPIAGRPFLELLLRQLRRYNFQRVILAVGYQRDVIRRHFGDRMFGLHLEYSAEEHPLGTGGALRNTAPLIESDITLVMNGDSYTDADLDSFVLGHIKAAADVSLIVVSADGREDCGSVLATQTGNVVSFKEKEVPTGGQYLNAGIYIMGRHLLYDMPSGVPVSLENEVLPRWLAEGKTIRVFPVPARCLDIGTPERYRSAQDALATVELENSPDGCKGLS
jgi:NDP-sugar pyrophosphorylase family protein